MKNKKLHVFSIMLIFAMLILAVSTSPPPPKEIKNSLGYEIREEIVFIKIKPRRLPNSYGNFNKDHFTSFYLCYDDIEVRQHFYYNPQGEYIIETRDNEGNIIEKIVSDQAPFEMYIKGIYFIIEIKNEFLKYRKHSLDSIMLGYMHGRSIYEVYLRKKPML
jgi:hypothetical protein